MLVHACRPEANQPPPPPPPTATKPPPVAVDRFAEARATMVTETIEKRGVQDPRVLAAMRKAPRHELVPIEARADSYANHPLPIGFDQTISQPYIVAAMTEAAQLTAGEKVLEVGTVIPVGKSGDQELKVITRRPDGTTSETLMGVRFVPMTGEAQNKSAK